MVAPVRCDPRLNLIEEDDVPVSPLARQPDGDESVGAEITVFFDEHLLAATPVDQLVERAAAFAGCPVGMVSARGESYVAGLPDRPYNGEPPLRVARRALPSGGRVWIAGAAPEMAEVFLTRMALTVEMWLRSTAQDTQTPGPLEVLLDEHASEDTRLRAARSLSLTGDARVRIAVCSGPGDAVTRFLTSLGTLPGVRVVSRLDEPPGRTVSLIVGGGDSLDLPDIPLGVRAAYGVRTSAPEAHKSYANARDAYRFTLPSPADEGPYPATAGVWTNGARLSGLAALSRLRRDEIETIPDIAILQEMTEKYGENILTMLEAFATTDSLRKAAASLYVHHNTLNYWVQKASADLGYSLSEPYRRAHLFISLCLFRLWRDKEFGG
jgi:hypothetical protein